MSREEMEAYKIRAGKAIQDELAHEKGKDGKKEMIEKVNKLIENQTIVWIRRSSGKWQECLVVKVSDNLSDVTVVWTEKQNVPNGEIVTNSSRDFEIEKFLKWQDEDHNK